LTKLIENSKKEGKLTEEEYLLKPGHYDSGCIARHERSGIQNIFLAQGLCCTIHRIWM
jgi:hypothetical protein